ncbi:MAG: hypothetical protein K6G72_08170 [Lachnospiraceae bacterium]|nr:hypothetical protein [Lachnospiraceae bacterium]
MKIVKRAVCFIFSLIFAIGISGCGKEAASADAQPETAASVSTEGVLEDDGVYLATIEKKSLSKDGSYARFMCKKDDKLYYIVSVYDEAEQSTRAYIRETDAITGEQTAEDIEVSFEAENTFINYLAATEDGYIVVAGSYAENNQTFYIARVSRDGSVEDEKCLSDMVDLPEDTYLYNGMVSDGVYTYIPFTDRLIVLNEQLNYKKTLSNGGYTNMCLGSDGILYFTVGYNGDVSTYDPKTDKVTEKIFSAASSSKIYTGAENELLIASSASLKSYDMKTGTVTKLFDFLDVNVNTDMFDTIYRSKDGDIHILFNEFEQSVEEYEGETITVSISIPYEAVVKRYEPGSVPEIEEIKLACFYANSDIKKAVNEFNMAHPNIRAKIKCYSDEYSDYQAMSDAFNKDLLNGEKYDVIMFDFQDITGYVEKGILENLMDYISKDSSFDTSEYYENILFAKKEGDKLYSITATASINGFMGITDIFGDKEKLSFDDIVKARAEFPDIKFIENYNYDILFFNTMLEGDYRVYLGEKEGEYNFDTDEFRKLCEVSATFQRTPDDYVYFHNEYDGFSDGSTVIGRANYYAIDSYLMCRAAGKNVKSYGGPSIDGNGYVLRASDAYSLSSLSTHKEEAWELIKCLLKAIPDYSSGFRAYKEAFKADIETMRARGKSGITVYMEDRKYVLYMEDGDAEILEDMVKNATVTKGMDGMIWGIVYEEIQPYFAKQKSLDEVIKVIQSRVNLYVEENR